MFLTKEKSILLVLLALTLFGCQQDPAPSANHAPPQAQANTTTNTAPANSAPSVPNPTQNVGMPVTMPLIDAMFADEAFAQDVKGNVQLSDEELTKIRDVARNSVLELSAEPSEDDARSTRAAT